MIAGFIRPGSRVADIGCDHGYLLAHLLKSGKSPFGIAADIAPGPLDAARKNLIGIKNVQFVLSDGLSQINPDDADDIVIAGMGGELIARILDNGAYFRLNQKRFILQPMTRAAHLREYLCKNGFEILSERAVISANRAYSVLFCAFTGLKESYHPAFFHIGKIPVPLDEAGVKLLMKTRAGLKNTLNGLSQTDAAMAQRTELIIKSIDAALTGGDPYGA